MKVLLVSPPQWAAYGMPRPPVYPPLGLLQVASVLESRGGTVWVADADAEGLTVHELLSRGRRWGVDWIGFTATTPSFPAARRWAARIKATGIPVVIGGPHASALPEEVLESACFDAVCVGEAEATVWRLAVSRDTVGEPLPGWWRPGIPPRGEGSRVDLDDLPLPAWHLLRRPDRYLPPDARALPVGTVMFSRGCPARCRFCQSTSLFGARVRYLSPERAVEHAWHVHRTIDARELHIIDDCFTADRSRALAILDALCRKGPPTSWAFGNGLRADMLDDELLGAMASLGVHSFGIGVETADDALAASAGKHRSLDQVARVIHAAHRRGMSVWGFFMLGLPGETPQTISSTVRLALELGVDVAKFEIFKPYPGTRAYDDLLREGAIRSEDWEDWGIHTPPVHDAGLSPRLVWRARRGAILSFYCRRPFSSLSRRTLTQIELNARSASFLLRTLMRPA